jgi:hypothetical protein
MICDKSVAPLCQHASCRWHKVHKLFLNLPCAGFDDDDDTGSEDDNDEGDAGLTQQHNNLLLLGLARMQRTLPALRILHIIAQSWVDNSAVWTILGRMTQLTALHMEMHQHLYDAVTLEHLSALQPLSSSLKSLFIKTAKRDMEDEDQQLQQQQYDFLRHLTSLDDLCLPVASEQALENSISSSIAGLTQLSRLCLDSWCVHGSLTGGAAGGIPLGDRICSALAQLTGLADLRVSSTSLMHTAQGHVQLFETHRTVLCLQIS